MPRLRFVLLAALVGAMGSLGAASAATAAWKRFSPPAAASASTNTGVARTSDGSLHVTWVANTQSTHEDLMETNVTANGALGPTSTIRADWGALEPAGIVTGPDGSSLHAFWGGQLNGDSTHQELNYASSLDGGQSWTLAPYNLLTGEQVGMGTVSAARLGSTYFQSWGSYVHAGNTPGPGYHFTASPADGCCGYDANIAANPNGGSVVVAWYSNQTDHDGVYVEGINPLSGQPSGSPALVPGTTGVTAAFEPAALTARTGAPGFVVGYGSGYPVASRFEAWVMGQPGPTYLGKSANDIDAFSLASSADGRVWAVWAATSNGKVRIVARRSNPSVTNWGSAVTIRPPVAGQDVWQLSSSAIGGALDVIAAAGPQEQIAEYQTRVLPGLTLSAKPSPLHRKKKQNVTFTVTDAGTPVKGAKVKAGGKSVKTGGNGKVTLKLGPFGKHVHKLTATVSDSGYTGTSIALHVI